MIHEQTRHKTHESEWDMFDLGIDILQSLSDLVLNWHKHVSGYPKILSYMKKMLSSKMTL